MLSCKQLLLNNTWTIRYNDNVIQFVYANQVQYEVEADHSIQITNVITKNLASVEVCEIQLPNWELYSVDNDLLFSSKNALQQCVTASEEVSFTKQMRGKLFAKSYKLGNWRLKSEHCKFLIYYNSVLQYELRPETLCVSLDFTSETEVTETPDFIKNENGSFTDIEVRILGVNVYRLTMSYQEIIGSDGFSLTTEVTEYATEPVDAVGSFITYNYDINKWMKIKKSAFIDSSFSNINGVPLSNDGFQFTSFQGTIDNINNFLMQENTNGRYMFSKIDFDIQFNIENFNTQNVINMAYMFSNCINFNRDISSWNVSNVINMAYMFWRCKNFNQDISSWNVSNVINMQSLFRSCENFNQDINFWNVSNVKDMSSMFNVATSFNQSLNNWIVSNVTNMSGMFFQATSFNQDISNWNVSSVTDMRYMFFKAETFNQDISNWNVLNVKDMSRMFNGANNFNNLNSTLDWDLDGKETDYMFTNSIYNNT